MNGGKPEAIEMAIDAGAAGLFALGIALVLAKLAPSAAFAGAGMAIAFAGCFRILRAVAPEESGFILPQFAPGRLEFDGPAELVLTEADRLQPPVGADGTCHPELVLDDVLARIGPGSRVVRLFDPAAMPTAGQMQARIDGHLHPGISETAPPDASQALYEALAELRRSLR